MNLSSKSVTWIGRLYDHRCPSCHVSDEHSNACYDPQDKTLANLCDQEVVLPVQLELGASSSSEHSCHSLLHGSADVDHAEVDHEDSPLLLGRLCCHMHLRGMIRQQVVGFIDGLHSSHMSPSRHALLAIKF